MIFLSISVCEWYIFVLMIVCSVRLQFFFWCLLDGSFWSTIYSSWIVSGSGFITICCAGYGADITCTEVLRSGLCLYNLRRSCILKHKISTSVHLNKYICLCIYLINSSTSFNLFKVVGVNDDSQVLVLLMLVLIPLVLALVSIL